MSIYKQGKIDLMRRKIIIIMLISVLLGLVGCGSNQRDTATTEMDTFVQQEEASEWKLSYHQLYHQYTDEDDVLMTSVKFEYPTVSEWSSDSAAASINGYFDEKTKEIEDNEAGKVSQAKEQYAYLSEDERSYWSGLTEDYIAKNTRNDSKIVSFVEKINEYNGGAHEEMQLRGVTFDALTGKKLELRDIVEDEMSFQEFAETWIKDELSKNSGGDYLFEDYEQYIPDILTADTWCLTDRGVEILCNPCLIGPYYMGVRYFDIPYEDIYGYIKEEYCMDDSEDRAFSIPYNEKVVVGQAGNKMEIELTAAEDEKFGTCKMSINIDGSVTELTDSAFYEEGTAYLLKRPEGKWVLAFSADEASDDYLTFIYELDGKIPVKKSEQNGKIRDVNLNYDNIMLEGRVDILGTWNGQSRYKLTADNELEKKDNGIYISNSQRTRIVPIKDVPANSVGDENVSQVLHAGTKVYPVYTDGQSYVVLRDENSREWRVDFQRRNYDIYIDGISETELFGELPYSG